MGAVITEKECPKCNVGAMVYIAFRAGAFRSNLVIEKLIFRCSNCEYVDEISGRPI